MPPSACRPPTAGSRTIGSARPRPIPSRAAGAFPGSPTRRPMSWPTRWRTRALAAAGRRLGRDLAFRRHLWGLGFKIAEAMDTSQRGMGLDWPTARELIRRSLAEARDDRGRRPRLRRRHRPAGARRHRWTRSGAAYEEQLEAIEAAGGRAILMASRALARAARIGRRLPRRLRRPDPAGAEPVILHWLGDMFDPQLAGYWGSDDVDAATETVLTLIREHAAQDRRHQDLAARREPRGRAAPAPAAGGEDVHRRRLQLCAS